MTSIIRSWKIVPSAIIAATFTAFFCASFLKGLTGIGFSTLCLGFMALFMDIRMAIPLVFLPSLSSNLMVMMDAGHFRESLKRFWCLFLVAIPGLLLGIWVLGTGDHQGPKAVLGVVMIMYGIWGLSKTGTVLSTRNERRLMGPVGFVSGLVNGLTGSQIMPVMPYLLSLKMDRDLFVQTINLSFTINSLIMMACFGKMGLISSHTLWVSLLGILPVGGGIYLGARLRKTISEAIFRKLVFVLLICLGLIIEIKFWLFS